MDVLEIWLRMMMVSRLPSLQALKVINRLMIVKKINHASLLQAGLNEKQSLQYLHRSEKQITSIFKWLEDCQHHLLTLADPKYPFLLKQIHHPPLVLFVMGNIEVLSTEQIALIGSRNATHYGSFWAKKFVRTFVEHNLTITSGLALGIDSIGHKIALENNGKTIAVFGSGLDYIYPKQHQALAEQITQQGALVSEYAPDTPPLAKNFPRRNRIISGLSRAVVVIEASMLSGSLITARYALEQNRDLFTLPGALGNEHYQGNHWLIQQGAYLMTDPQDLLTHLQSELQWLMPEPLFNSEPPLNTISSLNMPEADIIASGLIHFIDYQVTAIDSIAQRAQQSVSVILPQLMELELAGKIISVAGGYIKIN